ncbi:MAG: polysaccharide deacetylase family protein, partial [Thaumarchaeota archaeon]|nr:polysaccharide deacetylase family protein [Nitrososphaerota archaeon]
EVTGSIDVTIRYNTFDRADTYALTLKVYQDNNEDPFVVIGFPETNPVMVDSLPLDHKYKVEVYVNGMFSGFGKIVVNGDEEMEILIPPAGGMVFRVLYSDKSTPVADAIISVFSDDAFLWVQDSTDDNGKTKRFWLQSNNAIDGYYYATVTLDERVIYQSKDIINFFPEVQGDITIVLPWPETVEDLITVSVYNGTKKISRSDGNFVVEMYDFQNNKIDQNNVDYRGNAHFSNIKTGHYSFQALKIPDDPDAQPEFVGVASTAITGEENKIAIRKLVLGGLENTCNCVAFRFDDVQDFFLNDPQIGVFQLFQAKEAPLSIGIIGGFIGTDKKIVDFISNDIKRDNPTLEITSHSWNNSPLTNYDKEGQKELLLKTDNKIFDIFGVSPRVMVPPENLINNATFAAMKELGYTHITGHTETELFPPTLIQNQTLYYFPANSETAKLNSDTNLWDTQSNENILARIHDSLNNFGFAVVMMHPYEFSVTDLGIYSNKRNQEMLDQTSQLIDKVKQLGINIVSIGKIHEKISTVEKEDTSQDKQVDYLNCNCVAFRFVTIQDYWLDDVQIAVLNTFFIKGVTVTAGIIGNLFGNDAMLVDTIKSSLEINDQLIEIANNGWSYEDFTSLTKEEQSSLIKQSNDKITSVLGKAPTVFIPPLEKFNDGTISALIENDIKYISSSITKDPPPYRLNGTDFYHFPGGPAVGKYDIILGAIKGETHEETFADIQAYLDKYGFAVVTLQPQEFSIVEKNSYTNSVDQQQIQELELLIDKIQAQGLKIIPISKIDEQTTNAELQSIVTVTDISQTESKCNCVAFTFVTLQDYWLDDVQIKVIDTFIKNDASITTGIIGNLFGNDVKLVDYIKNTLKENKKSIEIANNGWNYEDFTSLTKEEQSSLIKQSNDKITSVLGKAPTVFIPPLEKFNDGTISALIENDIKYISSSIKKDPPPYRLNNAKFYHFPWSSAIGQFDPDLGIIVGSKHTGTLAEIELNIEKHDFAVVTLQPQEFSVIEDGAYTNTVDSLQIRELELLIAKIQALGYKIVLISDINQDSAGLSLPVWIKNNAGWWADEQIDDETFVQGIQFLINKKIMVIPPVDQSSRSELVTKIPDWIKNNAGWWADGSITDTDFVSGIQWLITSGIMKISA